MKAILSPPFSFTKINDFRNKTYLLAILVKILLILFSISLTNLLTLDYYSMEVCTGSVQLSEGVL
jgi:hypothetical protein